jgi:hypothetical protein
MICGHDLSTVWKVASLLMTYRAVLSAHLAVNVVHVGVGDVSKHYSIAIALHPWLLGVCLVDRHSLQRTTRLTTCLVQQYKC